jgi:hypothetical protein
MAKTRPGKDGAPLTVGALRKLLEGLPASAVVMCSDDGDGPCTADSASVNWFLSTNRELGGTCYERKRGPNTESLLYHELKVPIVVVDFVSLPKRQT